jgi:hypothetical protein
MSQLVMYRGPAGEYQILGHGFVRDVPQKVKDETLLGKIRVLSGFQILPDESESAAPEPRPASAGPTRTKA